MKKTLLWLWQLPQNICGIVYKALCKPNRFNVINSYGISFATVYEKKSRGSVSLGDYVFINENSNFRVIMHELGHQKQSRILGPLYLLVIGIPSIVHAALHDKCCKNDNYYHFYTEKWANKLAGLK